MIQQVEDVIIEQLEAAFPTYAVDALKEDVQSYSFTHPKAALVPILETSDWGSSPALSMRGREVLTQFNVMSFTHGLHGDPGAYELLRGVEDALEAVEVEGADGHPGGTLLIQRQFFVRSKAGPVYIYNTDVRLQRQT